MATQTGGAAEFDADERARIRRLIYDHERIMPALFGDGNGNKGLLSRFDAFMLRFEERAEIRAEEERRKDRRQNIRIAIFAVILSGAEVLTHMTGCAQTRISFGATPAQTSQTQHDAGLPPTFQPR